MAVITVTRDNFSQIVDQSEKKVLLDFWASWCGPCRMVAPIVEQIAEENENIIVGKVDVDAQVELASAFHIASIPTLLVMENGKPIAKAVGCQPKADIEKLIGKL